MTREQLKTLIDSYNWDDGFALPRQIVQDEACDLALALEVFYLGDGFGFFQTFAHNTGGSKEWFDFIAPLYDAIESGRYPRTGHHYSLPLSRVARYQLRKQNIPEIFLTDL